MQKAFEALGPSAVADLIDEFRGAVLKCVHDQNGNHVIQKCIEHVRNPPGGACRVGFIVDALRDHVYQPVETSLCCRGTPDFYILPRKRCVVSAT